MGVYE